MMTSPALAISDHQDYIKKLEQERFESDIREAHEVLAHMGERLHTMNPNGQSVRETQGKAGIFASGIWEWYGMQECEQIMKGSL